MEITHFISHSTGDSSTNTRNPLNSGNGSLPLPPPPQKDKNYNHGCVQEVLYFSACLYTYTLLCKTCNSLGKPCEKPKNQVLVFSLYKEKECTGKKGRKMF